MADNPIAAPAPQQHPLRNPSFRLLWAGNTISWTGDHFYLVALPWLILQCTGSSIVLGSITMMAAIPRAALMLLGGALTDRISPRRIMIFTASSRTVLVAAISVLIWMHMLQLWQLYILAFCFGIADAFAGPAAQAYLPSLVTPEQLPAANSVSQSTIQITTLVAPGPAGLFIKAFGTAWAFFIDAVSFLFIIGALWRLPDPPSTATGAPRRNMLRSILDGLNYVKSDVALASLMLVISVLNFAITGPASVGIAIIAKQKFGTPLAFGLLMSALAAGGLIGTLLAGLTKHRRRGRLLLLVSTAIGVCLGSIGLLNQALLLAGVLFFMSGTAAFLNVQMIAWFQQRIERTMMGRVMSVLMFASIGLMPFSLAAAGVALKWNLTGTFIIAGGMVLVVTLIAAAHRPVREID
jgi:Transmembrane secretion effector